MVADVGVGGVGQHTVPGAHPLHNGVVVAIVPARAARRAVRRATFSHHHVHQPRKYCTPTS